MKLANLIKNISVEENKKKVLLLPDDEWANTWTHGLALLSSIGGFLFIIQNFYFSKDFSYFLIFLIYALSLVSMYAASTLYHFLKNPILKKKCRILDHCAIYLFIAGSYTPFSLIVLKDAGGLTLFIQIWSLACFGVIFKLFFTHRFKILSTFFYLMMGWLVIFSMPGLLKNLHPQGLLLLITGGIFYTIGTLFYFFDQRRYFHAIWHLFTFAGSLCHFFCIVLYI